MMRNGNMVEFKKPSTVYVIVARHDEPGKISTLADFLDEHITFDEAMGYFENMYGELSLETITKHFGTFQNLWYNCYTDVMETMLEELSVMKCTDWYGFRLTYPNT